MTLPRKNHVVVHVKPRISTDEWTHSVHCNGVTVDGVQVPGTVWSVALSEIDGSPDPASVSIRLAVSKFETTCEPVPATTVSGVELGVEPALAVPCRVCQRVDYATEFCDGHTEDVITLAEAICAAIWGDDPCPNDCLFAHLDDAVVMIATGAERDLGDPEWRVVRWGDDEQYLVGWLDNSWGVIQVGDRLWGTDPNEEGPGVPRRLDELLAGLL